MPRLEDVLAELAALPHARAAALAGFDGLLVDEAFGSSGDRLPFALDGAVVELTHAWNGVRRACADYLGDGGASEVFAVADGGMVLSHTVGHAWFVMLWLEPETDLQPARAALRGAAARLAEVVA